MKKCFLGIIGIVGLSIVFLSSCKKEECLDCRANDVVMTTYVLGGGDSTITIYPVMTPSNHPMCDSMVYDPRKGSYVMPQEVYSFQKLCTVEEARDSLLAGNDTACPCRVNPATEWNDDKNAYFHIGNIKKFPYNRLYIKTQNDTTKMRMYTDYDNTNDLFVGEVAMDTTLGYYEYNNTKAVATGVYSYYLVIYKDEMHQTQIGDTIKGNFAIIRAKSDKNRNCQDQALDADDPLLN